MKKFISFCKSYLAEILFALVVVIVFIACVWILGVTWACCGVLLLLVIRSFLHVDDSKPQGPFCVPVNDADNADDPQPEPAEKLPYVYYDKPVEQVAHIIRYRSPYLGLDRAILFRPRKARGKPFDNVRGIQVAENLVMLRHILFTSNFPDDIREMAKQYEGRFPNKAEIEQIYAKFNEINQNLYECGEPLLQRWKYLYTSGDERADETMNYCLNFANGQDSLADCDSEVCTVLVEKSLPDVRQLVADIQAFKEKHLNNSNLDECDEFDVLCVVDSQKVRLPFSKRYLGKPIGIFPSKTSRNILS